MRAIDLLLSLAYIFEIIIKSFVSQCQNFVVWEHCTWGRTLMAMPDVQSSLNVRCDSLQDEIYIRKKASELS